MLTPVYTSYNLLITLEPLQELLYHSSLLCTTQKLRPHYCIWHENYIIRRGTIYLYNERTNVAMNKHPWNISNFFLWQTVWHYKQKGSDKSYLLCFETRINPVGSNSQLDQCIVPAIAKEMAFFDVRPFFFFFQMQKNKPQLCLNYAVKASKIIDDKSEI